MELTIYKSSIKNNTNDNFLDKTITDIKNKLRTEEEWKNKYFIKLNNIKNNLEEIIRLNPNKFEWIIINSHPLTTVDVNNIHKPKNINHLVNNFSIFYLVIEKKSRFSLKNLFSNNYGNNKSFLKLRIDKYMFQKTDNDNHSNIIKNFSYDFTMNNIIKTKSIKNFISYSEKRNEEIGYRYFYYLLEVFERNIHEYFKYY